MTRARDGDRPATALAPRRAVALGLVLGVVLAVCACGGPAATPPASETAPPVPASLTPGASTPTESGEPGVAIGSPVTGRLTKLLSEGLTRVRGFTLRLDDGTEVAFTIGRLENGVEFPPGHLSEHMSTSSAVRVFFRDEGGQRLVYRLEDGE